MNRTRAIEVLRTLRPRLEARGIAHAGIFGSVGRDTAGASSDVDVIVTPAPGQRLDLVDFGGVQTLLDEAFSGVDVDVVVEPIRRPELKAAVERDRLDAF
jgi:predicted nucleotidyltransferase